MIALQVDDPRWTALVEASPDALPFHHPSWSKLLAECYGYRPFLLAVANGAGGVAAALPTMEVRVPLRGTRWVALPFTDYCPPIRRAGLSEVDLVGELDAARRNAGVRNLEVRAGLQGPRSHTRSGAVTHRLRLPGNPETVFRGFSRSQVQRNIRRAEREGVEVHRGQQRRDLIEVFYRLHQQTRRRHGVPVQPRRYFSLLWDCLISQGLGFVSIAYSGNAAVAGAVFLTWNGTVTYKYGASDPAYWSLRPNHLIFWDAIRWSCTNGYHTLDFGRTDLSNTGLRAFKSGWGADESPLTYSRVGEGPAGASGEAVSAVIRPLIQRAPPWFCRALGELLYKYAA